MNTHRILGSVRIVTLFASLACLAGCSSVSTGAGPTAPTRMSRFSAYPIDDANSGAPAASRSNVARHGYGYVGG